MANNPNKYNDYKNGTTIPYVYFLKNKTTGLKYIGAKYSKGCDPINFWVNYFTSSNLVHKLIETYGSEDFECKILKTFNDEHDALKYERNLVEIASNRSGYLNLHHNFVIDDKTEHFLNKEMMRKMASFYGKIQAKEKIGLHKLSKEQKLKASSDGGKAAAIVNKERGTGIFDEEVRNRQHITLKEKQVSAYYDPELRFDISSKGGKVGAFSKTYYENNKMTEEDRIEAQRERGKKGGPKNKGFIWYNDGIKDYKYTKTQQDNLSFDEFIKLNIIFVKGSLNRTGIKKYNDGIKNFLYTQKERDLLSFEDFLASNPNFIKGEITKKNLKGTIMANDGIKSYMVTEEEMKIRNLIKGRLKK